MSCSKNQSSESAAAVVESAPVVESAVCNVSSDAVIEPSDWVDANNAFGLKMLAMANGNTVVSPFSAERALGMVYEGACNDTASEMRTALSLPDGANLSELGHEVEEAIAGNIGGEVAIHIDNRVWLEKTLTLQSDYVSNVEKNYGAKPQLVDFVGDSQNVRQRINDDIAKSTQNKILDLLAPGSINSLTRLVLTNAVYFKAPWKDNFNARATKQEAFKTADGEIMTDMMIHTKGHRVYQGEDYVSVLLDFKQGDFSMMIVLPNVADGENVGDALKKLEGSMSAEKIRIMHEMSDFMDVRLKMPKFKIETTAPMTDWLRSMGMVKAFDRSAEFSRMTGRNDLQVSSVIQKAYIAVDEDGAEAAAATAAIMMMKTAMPPRRDLIEVTVDHPFMFVLMDEVTGSALFMGRVVKP